MPLKNGEKTPGSDTAYEKMIGNKKAGKSPQKNGKEIYDAEGWSDLPEIEAGAEEKQRFQTKKEHEMMMAQESRRKKLGVSKWDSKRKPSK